MKGLWIPLELLQRQDISHAERIVAAFVGSFDKGFFGSNEYIAGCLGMNLRSVERLMVSLKKKGFKTRIRLRNNANETTQSCV
jgi:hypothetical protein